MPNVESIDFSLLTLANVYEKLLSKYFVQKKSEKFVSNTNCFQSQNCLIDYLVLIIKYTHFYNTCRFTRIRERDILFLYKIISSRNEHT